MKFKINLNQPSKNFKRLPSLALKCQNSKKDKTQSRSVHMVMWTFYRRLLTLTSRCSARKMRKINIEQLQPLYSCLSSQLDCFSKMLKETSGNPKLNLSLAIVEIDSIKSMVSTVPHSSMIIKLSTPNLESQKRMKLRSIWKLVKPPCSTTRSKEQLVVNSTFLTMNLFLNQALMC